MPAPRKAVAMAPADVTEAKLSPLEAVEAEVDAGDGTVEVTLADTRVRVKPVGAWRSSGVSAMRQGDFTAWAETCLATPDDVAVWLEVDPTLDECEVFFREWGAATGQDQGESRASRRSSRSTARR
jgi:hypothetical protein